MAYSIPHSTASVHGQILASARSVADLADAHDVALAASRLLRRVIGGDDVLSMTLDIVGPGTRVLSGDDLGADPCLGADLARVGHLHPAVLSYLQPGDDLGPRRITDVVPQRAWLRSPAYDEAFRHRGGRFQLSLVTRLTPTEGIGWVLLRQGRDFEDRELVLAQLLLPHLVMMAEHARLLPLTGTPGAPLTRRERGVADLLAQGATATQIAHRLDIAEPTVRKHLEHIYAKLEVHDRLSAVLLLADRKYAVPRIAAPRRPAEG